MPGRLAGDPWMNAGGEQRGAWHRHWRAATNQKPKPPFDARRPCWFLTKWKARPDGSVKRGLFNGPATGPAAFPRSSRSAALRHALRLCRRAPAGLVLEMDVCQRGSRRRRGRWTGFGLSGGPGRREAALGQAQGLASAVRSAFWSDRSASPGHSVWVSSGELSRGREGVKALSPEL